MSDGTGQRELRRAMATYLNKTGAGEYTLPKLTGATQILSNNKNSPMSKIKTKTKLTWSPGRDVEFVGRSSPPPTFYSPKSDRPFPAMKYSVGLNKRFT